MRRAEDILRDALELPPEDRAEIATRLTASLGQREWEKAWAREAERRWHEMVEDPSLACDWDDLQPDLDDIVEQARKNS